MILDGCACPDAELITGEVCIIGGGPAGITLAHELASSNLKVILVESGSEGSPSTAESLNMGGEVSEGYAPLSLFRRRVLGGASVVWAGRCVPFDPIDFERREHVPLSGWPIRYAEVQSYYERASAYCEAGAGDYVSGAALQSAPPFIEGFSSDEVLTSSYERFSTPTNFGKTYGPALHASLNVVVLTNTTCVELVSRTDGAVVMARCATLSNTSLRVKADKFVVAAGGLESYRLLANSKAPAGHSLGDSGGMLGRCLMSHLEGTIGSLVLDRSDRPVAWGFERSHDGVYGRRRITVAPEVQRQRRTLNFTARLHHAVIADPRHRNAVLSAMFLVKMMLLPEYRPKISALSGSENVPGGLALWSMHAKNVLLGSPALASFSAGWFWRRHLVYRRIPYVVLQSRAGRYPLEINGEESPNPRNRVFLTGNRDRFGARQIAVEWHPTETDFASIAANCRILRDAFAKTGVARYEFDDTTLDEDVRRLTPIGGHHMGVTRMSASAEDGVVDGNCQVHGSSNLFVASASVFPTSSHANPTLTIVALSLRLADHLVKLARSAPGIERRESGKAIGSSALERHAEVAVGCTRSGVAGSTNPMAHVCPGVATFVQPAGGLLVSALTGFLPPESGGVSLARVAQPGEQVQQLPDGKASSGGTR